ncbi:MAG: ThuA domain-containing protein [Bryobacterales bacterium]|nr:ThuA domain-containing protein [Bryobacterales bacterium]
MRRCVLFLCAAAAWAQPHVVFVTGDDEYRSESSMPAIARILERHHGLRTSVAMAKPSPATMDNIEGLEALESADLAVFYLRWRTLPRAQMDRIVAYLDAGKPVAGLRTSTHAFRYPEGSPYAVWNDGFGIDVLGQKWIRHHGHQSRTAVSTTGDHPILRGLPQHFEVRSWLYVVEPLHGDAVPLLTGRALNPQGGKDWGPQPVAWTKTWRGARVFMTTLGHPEDFSVLAVRRLLIHGILWALGRDIPAAGAAADFPVPYDPPASGIARPSR